MNVAIHLSGFVQQGGDGEARAVHAEIWSHMQEIIIIVGIDLYPNKLEKAGLKSSKML